MLWHTAIRLTVFECAVSRIDLCPVTGSPFRDTRYRVYLYVCLSVCLFVCLSGWRSGSESRCSQACPTCCRSRSAKPDRGYSPGPP